jgi:hypothetical protein
MVGKLALCALIFAAGVISGYDFADRSFAERYKVVSNFCLRGD